MKINYTHALTRSPTKNKRVQNRETCWNKKPILEPVHLKYKLSVKNCAADGAR